MGRESKAAGRQWSVPARQPGEAKSMNPGKAAPRPGKLVSPRVLRAIEVSDLESRLAALEGRRELGIHRECNRI